MLVNFTSFENPVAVTIQLLKELKVNFTNKTVNTIILNHPDYPSILSIHDTLNSLKVKTAAMVCKVEDFGTLPTPFIAFTNSYENPFVLVTEVKNSLFVYVDESNKKRVKRSLEFVDEFKSVVLLAEASEHSGESNYKHSRKAQLKEDLKLPGIIATGIATIIAVVISAIVNHFQFVLSLSLLLVLNLFGLFVTSILLWYEIDKTNPKLQKICTGGKKTNCNSILNSKASKIFGVSWSSLGFIYFAGSFLICLLSAFGNSLPLVFVMLTCLGAASYIPFSIIYQWKIAKQWCPLCLTIQAILFIEFIVSLLSITSKFQNIQFVGLISQLPIFLLVFLIPIIMWIIINPLLLANQLAKENFHKLQRLKFDPDVFKTLLTKQKFIGEVDSRLGIVLGDERASHIIIKACNPYCQPCARAHSEIEKLLEETSNLKVQIIYTATSHPKDERYFPVRHFLAIQSQRDKMKTKRALDDWYLADVKDYNVFANKYPLNNEINMQDAEVNKMNQWCRRMEISYTPTIFFDGYQLPDAYDITDLKYFLLE